MNIPQLLFPALLVPVISCSTEGGSEGYVVIERIDTIPDPVNGLSPPSISTSTFDNIHRTCALYVAIRSGAWERPVAFGMAVDESMVHWNLCPGGKMVACAPPGAKSDTTHVGIPWPYSEGSEL